MSDLIPAPAAALVKVFTQPFSPPRFHSYHRQASILQMLWDINYPEIFLRYTQVWLNNQEIAKTAWETQIINPGDYVMVCLAPRGKHGRTIFMVFVAIAATIASALTYGALSYPAGLAWGSLAAGLAAGLVGATVGVVGNLLATALFPPPHAALPLTALTADTSEQSQDQTTNFLTGVGNKNPAFEKVPKVLGCRRMVPPWAARWYTEVLGSDQYLRIVYCWGIGPVQLEDLRIGETPLENFHDYQVEHRYGYPDDEPLTLYANDVYEETLNLRIRKGDGWQRRETQEDADEISIDLTFNALFHLDNQNNKVTVTVGFRVRYRPVGTTEWFYRPDFYVVGCSTTAVRKGLYWGVSPSTGKYEVEIQRITDDHYDIRTSSESYWTALRTIRYTYPAEFNFPVPLALTALRIRASDQLNGVIKDLNGVVTSILPDWDAATQTWINRATTNPASAYRYALQGSAGVRQLSNSRIDLLALQEWHEKCESLGLKINQIFDSQQSLAEALRLIAACGRAVPTTLSGNSKWSIIFDEVQSQPIQHFTPSNSWNFSSSIEYPDLPHAFRCPFFNQEEDFQPDERIVYDDDYNANNASMYETLEFRGVTNPAQVWRLGRYHLAQAKLRRERATLETDIEHLACVRGDLVKVVSDVTLWGGQSAWIKEVVLDSALGYPAGLELTQPVIMTMGRDYNVRIRTKNGTSLLIDVDRPLVAGWLEGGWMSGDGWFGGGGPLSTSIETTTITFAELWLGETYPEAGDLVLFGVKEMESRDMIVAGIFPRHDLSARLELVEYDEAIYLADTEEIPPYDSMITPLPEWDVPVIDLIRSDGSVLTLDANGNWQSQMLVSVRPICTTVNNIIGIQVGWRPQDTDESPLYSFARSFQAFCFPVQSGLEYEVRARFVKATGKVSLWSAVVYHTVQGKEWPPSKPTGFFIEQQKQVLTFSWTPIPDLDVAGYELRYGDISGSWETANLITTLYSGNSFSTTMVPAGVWKFYLKALDSTGNYSEEAATIDFQVMQFYDLLFYQGQWPLWSGTKTNFHLNPLTGNLNPQDQVLASSSSNIFAQTLINPFPSYSYEANEIDLGEDKEVRIWHKVHRTFITGHGTTEPTYQIDYKLAGGSYDGFEDWTVDFAEARYIKAKIVSTVPLRLQDFYPVVDRDA